MLGFFLVNQHHFTVVARPLPRPQVSCVNCAHRGNATARKKTQPWTLRNTVPPTRGTQR